jgi:hypothetical protein
MKINTKNSPCSTLPPVRINPFDSYFKGQKGLIPSTVKLSAKICEAYPKKKGRATIGR